jgi:hypothetical protein
MEDDMATITHGKDRLSIRIRASLPFPVGILYNTVYFETVILADRLAMRKCKSNMRRAVAGHPKREDHWKSRHP